MEDTVEKSILDELLEEFVKLRVVVVDDELPIRQDLRSYPWEAYGAVLVGEAEEGEEALSLCKELLPDVVITDISMPIMDGLTFIRLMREECPGTQVIMLTCHRDFEYAREAIKLGAADYLVKVTLTEDELGAAMEKARRRLVEEASRARRIKAGKKQRLAKTILGNSSPSFGDLGMPVEIPLRFAYLMVDVDPTHRLIVHHEIQQELFKQEKDYADTVTWIPYRGDGYLIFFHVFSHDAVQLRFKVKSLLAGVRERLDGGLSYIQTEVRVRAAISELLRTDREWPERLDQTSQWRYASFYDEREDDIYLGKPVPLQTGTTAAIEEIWRILQHCLSDPARLKEEIDHKWVPLCRKVRLVPAVLKSLMKSGFERLAAEGWPAGSSSVSEQLDNARTLSELAACLIMFGMKSFGVDTGCRKEILKAKSYIREHYAEALTLSEVAEHVGFSPHYLSRLFQEELGESFNGFVTRLRVEKAIELLAEGRLKVYEVAEKVGIPNYRYFSVLFRKWTGVSPTEYKKG